MVATDNNKDSIKAHLRVHSILKGLLMFTGFEGPVSRWLPITSMDFSNHGALQVTYACIASEAAQLIISHKPYADAAASFQWTNMAAFLVTLASRKTTLDACLVEVASSSRFRAVVGKAYCAEQQTDTVLGTRQVETVDRRVQVDLDASMVQPLPTADHIKSRIAGDSITTLVSTAVGACRVKGQKYPQCINMYLAQALKALKPPDLNITPCVVNCRLRSLTHAVPLWVVHW